MVRRLFVADWQGLVSRRWVFADWRGLMVRRLFVADWQGLVSRLWMNPRSQRQGMTRLEFPLGKLGWIHDCLETWVFQRRCLILGIGQNRRPGCTEDWVDWWVELECSQVVDLEAGLNWQAGTFPIVSVGAPWIEYSPAVRSFRY